MSSEDKTSKAAESVVRTPVTRRDFLKTAGVAGSLSAPPAGSAACSPRAAAARPATAAARARAARSRSASCRRSPVRWRPSARRTSSASTSGTPPSRTASRRDGAVHPIEIIIKDSQSDSNRAATVAGDLIPNDSVDMMMVASTPDTVNPVADQCEARRALRLQRLPVAGRTSSAAAATPSRALQVDVPLLLGPRGRHRRLHGHVGRAPDQQERRRDVAERRRRQRLGRPEDRPAACCGRPATRASTPAAIQDGTEDFTPQISKFKAAGCEILTGVLIPPDFTNFWKQAYQQGFKPEAATIGKALLFPSAVEALGDIGYGLSTEVWWSPTHPFKSSLTGQTCQELADAFTTATGKQWTQPILHYAVFEVVADALKRTDEHRRQGVDPRRHQGDQARHHRRHGRTGRPAHRRTRARTSARPRWSAASGSRATKYPYDLEIVAATPSTPRGPHPTARSQPIEY